MCFHTARLNKDPAFAIQDDLRNGAAPCSDNGQAISHGFEVRHPECFFLPAGPTTVVRRKQVRFRTQAFPFALRDFPEKFDSIPMG